VIAGAVNDDGSTCPEGDPPLFGGGDYVGVRPPQAFATARLVARPVRPEDAREAFAVYASDPEVTRLLNWRAHERVEPLAEFFGQCAAGWRAGAGHVAYLLRRTEDGAVVGSIGFERGGGKVMFGYVLGRQYWGLGYMSEALRHLVEWSLDQPDIWRAWAYCDVENRASARVMEKAGMQREGLLRRWHVCPQIGPGLRDCLVYAKVK
jgi:[ribosomal protein S5]-alanine N-acetyltransferase